MVKKSKAVRISQEMEDGLKEYANKNDISVTQASREWAKIVKEIKIRNKKIKKEIVF